jgi:hypothetical protein
MNVNAPPSSGESEEESEFELESNSESEPEIGPETPGDRSAPWTPLYLAAEHGNEAEVVALLAAGAHVDAVVPGAELQATALWIACAKGRTNIIRILIDANADVNWYEQPKGTPLHAAAVNGYYASIKILLSAGANPNLGPSSYAACLNRYGHKTEAPSRRMLGLLLQHGAAMKEDARYDARNDYNECTWQYHERVVKAGGYDALVKTRRRVLSSFVDKCVEGKFGRQAPAEVCGHVAAFLAPPGGY